MKFGMCVQNPQVDFIPFVAQCGYDYIECRFNLFTTEDPEVCKKYVRLLKENNIPCDTCNCFMPGEIKVTGDDVDEKVIAEYIEKGMKGFSEIGGKVVVFGSGGSRNIPDGFDREKGMEQIVHFLRDIAGPLAAKYGLTIVTEPLCHAASNVLNTVKEVVALSEKVQHPNVSSLADLYHMAQENETVESLLCYDGKLAHSHIAEPADRKYPKTTDNYDYTAFFANLEKIGCPRCSVEGSTKDFEKDAKESIELYRSLKF